MTWPIATDYQDAIQNHHISLIPTHLRTYTPVLDKGGFPKLAAGNFACVFRLGDGHQDVAVRCFLRPVTDQERRYRLISEHMRNFSSPNLVGFSYVASGIRIRGQSFPIVTMEWAEGLTLDRFIKRNLGNPDILRRLAARWRGLVANLRGGFMAHGDLQHGNVLADDHGLYLVDYDAMFISPFANDKSPEIGHPNYQHPRRKAENYDCDIDNFAALVIYTSIKAIAAEPLVWDEFSTGDNLLFSKEDYADAGRSRCFKRLKSSPDRVVTTLVGLIEECCSKEVCDVPYLESILQGGSFPAMPPAKAQVGKQQVKRTPPQGQTTTASRQQVICTNCGAANAAHQLYCMKCSSTLPPGSRPCSSCLHEKPIRAVFCRHCGVKA